MIKENDDPIKIMTNYPLSKLYIQSIKSDIKKNSEKQLELVKAKKYYQVFENSELADICNNVHSCVNYALKSVLRDRIWNPLKPLWKLLANVNYNINNYPEYYKNLLNFKQFPNYFEETIRKDVIRTTHNEEMRQKLTNVLNAYVKRNSQIGYCQGFNYIAYHLLNSSQYTEEETFWFLCHLFETILPPNYYNNLYGVLSDDHIIRDLLSHLNPLLVLHMRQLQIETSLFTIQWLVCCFTFHNCIADTLIDLILIDGSKVMISAVLTYINLLEHSLLQTQDIASFIMTIEQQISTCSNREQFLTEYNKIYINNKILQFVRQDYSNRVVSYIQESNSQKAQSIDIYLEQIKKKPCQIDFPICIYQLEAWSRNKKHLDNVVIKEGEIHVRWEYEQTKNRRSILDDSDNMMVEINHLCQQDDMALIREIQYKDLQQTQLLDLRQIQTTHKANQRARSPIKEMLLLPLKALSQKDQELKLKMNPKKYKIERNQMTSSVTNFKQRSSYQPTKQRVRSPHYRHSQKPTDNHNHSSQMGSTDETQKEVATIRESMTIQFLTELARNKNLINVEFDDN